MEAAADAARTGHSTSAAQLTSTAQTIARIMREHREISLNLSPHWVAAPLNAEEPYEWHFTLRGPPDSAFEGGVYHGRIVLPKNYPFAPPSLMMLTRNGRFEVNKKICLSASSHHPELWQPAWGIRTLLDALCAFFDTPAQGALNSLDASEAERRRFAAESGAWICPVCRKSNAELVEAGCTAPSRELPELPSPLEAQAKHARQSGASAIKTTSSNDTNDSRSAVRATGARGAGSPNSISATVPPPAPTRVPLNSASARRRAARNQRPLLTQIFQLPATPLEAAIALADLLVVLLLLTSFLLLFNLALEPPELSVLQPSPPLSFRH